MPRTAAAGLRRTTSAAGERQSRFEAMNVGTIAAASRMTKRPGVGVRVRPAEDVADEALAGDPRQEGEERAGGQEPAGSPGHERS